jgi:hypothetical protein
MRAAQYSYHGGKNNILPGHYPAWNMNVASLDISSAYPFAMSLLPSFSKADLYKKARAKIDDKRTYNNGVARLGVYLISGVADNCKWPSLFDLSFNPIRGDFTNVWVHSADLNAAITNDEVKLRSISGYYYDVANDKWPSPFKAFVDDFYKKKEDATDPVRRYLFKTVLNSLYGKFIQTTKKEDEETGDHYYEAGGMYHPFIASSITAHTRGYIHQLEHEFSAIHTATDGIFAPNKKTLTTKLRGFNKANGVDKGLGSVKLEAEGDLLLLRNKLYILYNDVGGFSSKYLKDKTIIKYAMHGFQNSIYELEKLIITNKRKYTTNRPNQLRESLKSKGVKVPNNFETRDMVLRIGPIQVIK